MAIKNVEFDVNLQSPKKQYSFEQLAVFTNDKLSVNLVFNILDMTSVELTGKTAEVLLYMADGSFFQSTSVSVSGTKFNYIVKPNEAKHAGLTKVQLVVKDGTKDIASSLFEFRIENGLEEKVVQEVIVRDWETITTEARAFIAEMKVNEAAREGRFVSLKTATEQELETVKSDSKSTIQTMITSGNSAIKVSESNALESANIAQKAMTDFLAMVGKDIATLDSAGKLSASQIPPLAINDTFVVNSTDEIVLLTAQRGDVAVHLVSELVSDAYILSVDEPTVLANWIKLGVSYVAEAGHAQTATNASNAEKINNHRLVTMTQAEYDLSAKAPDTVYLVGG